MGGASGFPSATASSFPTPVTSIMKSLNVEVVPIVADCYVECYLRIADEIEHRIKAYPELIPIPKSPEERYNYSIQSPRPIEKQKSFNFPVIPVKT